MAATVRRTAQVAEVGKHDRGQTCDGIYAARHAVYASSMRCACSGVNWYIQSSYVALSASSWRRQPDGTRDRLVRNTASAAVRPPCSAYRSTTPHVRRGGVARSASMAALTG